MKTLLLTSLAIALSGTVAFADTSPIVEESALAPLPTTETGHGETVDTFMGLCVQNQSQSVQDLMSRVRSSGWTVFHEQSQIADDTMSAVFEAEASSKPGDTCGLHVTLEETENEELLCEVVVSQFCQRGPGGVRDTILSELSHTDNLTLDLVSTSDENRRLQDHEHQVYRVAGGDGPLVRVADTGGTIYLSSISTLRKP